MAENNDKYDLELDVTGLLCPLPVLKLRKILKNITQGKVVKCIATDPASLQDVADFCQATGHILQAQYSDHQCERFQPWQEIFIHYVEKGLHK